MTSSATAQAALAETFLALHNPGTPLLVPNPWDAGSAKLFASLGFSALATTSSGFALTLGRVDYGLARDQALAGAAAIAAATPLAVSADLENGFAHDPRGVSDTVEGAIAAGLAGCSIEDHTGDPADPIYDIDHAAERVAAAAEAAHGGTVHLVLTARAENYLHGRADLDDTIERLCAYERAGADVVYAPGLVTSHDIGRIVEAVEVPLNVLLSPGGPTVPELAALGVARISIGGAFSLVAFEAVATAAREFLGPGTLGFLERAATGRTLAADALQIEDPA